MVFAAEYPFLNIFWNMVIFFAWVIWIWMMIIVISDVFRRHDLSGGAKAAWIIFMIILPFLGVLIYLIKHSEGLAERRSQDAYAMAARTVEASGGTVGGGHAAEIEKAKGLLDSGAITQAEFDTLKAKVLA